MSLTDALEKYGDELIYVRGRTVTTAKRYCMVIRKFANGKESLADIFTIDDLARYSKERQAQIVPAWLAYELTVIRGFAKWLAKRKFLEDDPYENVPPFRYEPTPPRALRWTEAEAAVDNASVGGKFPKRDHALLYFMLHTACRTGEALNATIRDIDMQAGTVMFVNTKGKRPRTVFLSDSLKGVLKNYLEYRAARWPKSEWLFPSSRGNQLNKNDLTAMKRRHGIAVDISRFRATTATKLLKETKDLRLVQDVLGHTSIETTAKYLTVWDEDKKRAAVALDK